MSNRISTEVARNVRVLLNQGINKSKISSMLRMSKKTVNKISKGYKGDPTVGADLFAECNPYRCKTCGATIKTVPCVACTNQAKSLPPDKRFCPRCGIPVKQVFVNKHNATCGNGHLFNLQECLSALPSACNNCDLSHQCEFSYDIYNVGSVAGIDCLAAK